jgi:urease beta subunit
MAAQGNNDGHRIAELTAKAAARYEPGEAIQVTKLSEFGHARIVTFFHLGEKSRRATKIRVFWQARA